MRAPSSLFVALAACACALGAAPACGDPISVPTDGDSTIASGFGGAPPSTSSFGGGGGPGQGGAGGIDGEGGSLPPVGVGLVANPLRDGESLTPAQERAREVEAAASTFAIGGSVFATKRTWRAASEATFLQDAQLAAAGCPSPDCRPAVLTLAVVDGLLDGRPEALGGEPWSSEASFDAMDESIDAAMNALGPILTFLAIGARVDRWLEEHEDDAGDLEALLAHAVERARDHPSAREDLLVGIGLSREGALSTTVPATDLRAIGNATMVSLFPGLHDVADSTVVPSPGSIALDLDAIDDVDPGRPVALIEVGYPSSEEVGADDEAQGLFFDALFGALATRRESFPLVVVSRLHDLGAAACAAEGLGLDEEEELVLAYRCSTGVRDDSGQAKPAWASFVVGAAQLASGATPVGP